MQKRGTSAMAHQKKAAKQYANAPSIRPPRASGSENGNAVGSGATATGGSAATSAPEPEPEPAMSTPVKTTLDKSLFVTPDRPGSANGYPALNLAEASEHYFDRKSKGKAVDPQTPTPDIQRGPSFWGIGEFKYVHEPEDVIKSLASFQPEDHLQGFNPAGYSLAFRTTIPPPPNSRVLGNDTHQPFPFLNLSQHTTTSAFEQQNDTLRRFTESAKEMGEEVQRLREKDQYYADMFYRSEMQRQEDAKKIEELREQGVKDQARMRGLEEQLVAKNEEARNNAFDEIVQFALKAMAKKD